jgi:phosphoribosyl-ATP pyrophosphohydrolase
MAKKTPAKKITPKRNSRKNVPEKKLSAKKARASAALNRAPTDPAIHARAIGASSAVLDRLYAVVVSRRDADPTVSHSARLLSRGTAKVAQKFGEESVECLIEAVAGNVDALISESADVLYHMLVMWVDAGVRPDDVWTELHRREGVSGISEKASRARAPIRSGIASTKIP